MKGIQTLGTICLVSGSHSHPFEVNNSKSSEPSGSTIRASASVFILMVGRPAVLRGRATIGEDIPCLFLPTARDAEEAGGVRFLVPRFAFPAWDIDLFALKCSAAVPDEDE